MEKLTPPDNDREGPCMVFDTLEGADFKINIKGKEVTDEKGQKKIQPDYALCSFISAKPFMDGDKTKVDAILEKRYKMDDIKKTKTYDEILLKYEKVRGDVVGLSKEESYPSPHFMQTEKPAAPASTPAATQPAPATAPAAETPKVEVTPKVEEKKPINLNLEDDEDAFLANLRKKRNG